MGDCGLQRISHSGHRNSETHHRAVSHGFPQSGTCDAKRNVGVRIKNPCLHPCVFKKIDEGPPETTVSDHGNSLAAHHNRLSDNFGAGSSTQS